LSVKKGKRNEKKHVTACNLNWRKKGKERNKKEI
jgi:hypothetical protein